MLTREEIIEKQIAVLKACADGKTIEFSERGENRWIERSWDDSQRFDWIHYDYRIKPESTYRPFKNGEECWTEMQKHQPLGWTNRGNGFYDYIKITSVTEDGIYYRRDHTYTKLKYDYMLESGITFADGAPFGIKEE